MSVSEGTNNEHVQEALKLLADTLKGGKDFAVEQTPLLVQEVIRWGIASYSFMSVLFVVLTCVWAYTARLTYKRRATCEEDENRNWLAVGSILSALCAAASAITAACNLYGLAYVIAAPRLYVIEQLTQMVR